METVNSLPQQVQACPPSADCAPPGLLADVSVIIPVGPGELAWRSLLADLAGLAIDSELFLVAAEDEPTDFSALVTTCGIRCPVRWILTNTGRAQQMNLGARFSTLRHLWFLHADSRLCPAALLALERSAETEPNALHYFELTFQKDGPSLTRWNAWGARVRSRYLGLPFGDQGFCLPRELFSRLGAFDEHAPYGEDHLLVWSARQQGIPIRSVGAHIATSARKYEANGWLRVTAKHAWLTWRQAVPQWCKWLLSEGRHASGDARSLSSLRH